jgi:hypothetical protein
MSNVTLIDADQNRQKIRALGIDWTTDEQEFAHPYGADPRIKVTQDRPYISFERVGEDTFRVVSDCVPFTADTFEMPVGAALTVDLPGKPGNQPALYIDEYWYI